jgi:hypothetical protein
MSREADSGARGGQPMPRRLGAHPPVEQTPKPKPKPKPPGTSFEGPRNAMIGLGAICLVGMIALFFNWYASQVASLSSRADRAGDARRKSLDPKNIMKGPAGPQKRAGTSSPPPQASPGAIAGSGRVIAPTTKRIEDLVVGVEAAKVGPILLKNNRYVPGPYVTLHLRVTNLSDAPYNYKSWSQQTKGILLCDQNRNYYNRVMIDEPPIVEQTILPGNTINDIIAFEPPLKLYGYLDLDLPARPYQTYYLFRISSGMVEIVADPKPQVQKAPPPPVAPPPPPFNPENDPQLRIKVRGEYNSGVASIERKARGMGFDRARKYRITAKEQLINDLAETFSLSPSQIRGMTR